MIKLEEKFSATVVMDGVIIPNLWDIKINLYPDPEKIRAQKDYMKVVERITYFITETLESSILLGPMSFDRFSKGLGGLQGKVHFLPDEPFDHMLAICLFSKIHSIIEEIFMVDSITVSSYQSQGISHEHSLDTGDANTLKQVALPGYETYADYWYKRDCQWFTLSEEGLKLKSKTWEELKLGLDREPGTVVNLKDFKNISKPGKNDDPET